MGYTGKYADVVFFLLGFLLIARDELEIKIFEYYIGNVIGLFVNKKSTLFPPE